MVSEPFGEGERPSPDAIDRIVTRLGAHRSLPAVGGTSPPALGPPSPVADESRLTREPVSEVVVDPSSIYVTLELLGASRETLEVTTTQNRLTVHALDEAAPGLHRDIDLLTPCGPVTANVTNRYGVPPDTLRPVRTNRFPVRPGD